MIEVITKKNNVFVIRLDENSLSALMMIVAGANQTEIQSVSDLIRFELDYMVENYHVACSDPFGNVPDEQPGDS